MVREPLQWLLGLERHVEKHVVVPLLGHAARGPACDDWTPPSWLLPHQVDAARRIAGSLTAFRGALLADATGLGKTYVALSVATRYRAPVVLAPAALLPQWRRTASALGAVPSIVTLESVSRGARIPHGDLVIIDEAHHVRNPLTRRYNAICRRVSRSHLLLLTATPVANGPRDLVALLRLFLADNALAILGVPSLEAALAERRYHDVTRAAAAVIVSRSPASLPGEPLALPQPSDVVLADASPLPPDDLARALAAVDALQFPGAGGDAPVAALLRLHLAHRLASSVAAFRETIGHHLAYLRRATAAAARGEQLPRGAARILFGPDDDPQLSLELTLSSPVNRADLDAERGRLLALRDLLPVQDLPGEGSKVAALERLLAGRTGRKTIVFTAARATALGLAHALGWRHIAVASAAGAEIASGRIPLEQALTWFAPRARRGTPPTAAATIDTLIATDLVSEGLDLQDADAIVHFDLPWTPLRLAQRLGRIARLGGPHATVTVWWFVPPAPLDARLRLSGRLAAKAFVQRRLGTAAPRRIGCARATAGAFHWRECLVALPAGSGANGAEPVRCWHAVRGVDAAAFALSWSVAPSIEVPELLLLAGTPPAPTSTYRALWHDVHRLLAAPSAADEPAERWAAPLHAIVRDRIAATARPPANRDARALARSILRRAAVAARERDVALLGRLDATLTRVQAGLPTGPERALSDLLRGRPSLASLDQWLGAVTAPATRAPTVRLTAALIGTPE